MATPLFDGVALEECLIKFSTKHFKGLLLEIFGFFNPLVAQSIDKGFSFGRAEIFTEKLVDGEKIDGKREDAATGHGFNAVDKWPEFSKAAHITPNSFVISIKNVGAIAVDHDVSIRIALRVAISGDVITRIPNFNITIEFFDKLPSSDCA